MAFSIRTTRRGSRDAKPQATRSKAVSKPYPGWWQGAASIAAIAIGGSLAAVIGTLLARRVGKRHEDYYANQIDHGRILLRVRARDVKREALAVKIMKRNSGRDVHVHAWSE